MCSDTSSHSLEPMRAPIFGVIAISLLLQSITSGQVAPSGVVGAAPTPATIAETERIIITGSYIPSAEEVAANPVLTINRGLLEKSGERTAEELIKNLTIANANGAPISNNATTITPGASSISLRGLQPSATLVLINGRRVAPYPIGQNGTESFVDLNSIPKAAIWLPD